MAYTGSKYTDKVGTIVADLSSDVYTSTTRNPFPNGQCTWYCFGRAFERYGGPIQVSGNAGTWYANIVVGNGVSKRSASSGPVSKSIASFGNSGAGHVVFVEQVNGNDVYFTEGNSWCPDGQVQKKTVSEFKTLWGNTLAGYIVLAAYNPPTGG